jgi:hypothetical protein
MCDNTNVCCQGDSPPGLHCTCGCNLGPSNPLPENRSVPKEDPFFKELASQVKGILLDSYVELSLCHVSALQLFMLHISKRTSEPVDAYEYI